MQISSGNKFHRLFESKNIWKMTKNNNQLYYRDYSERLMQKVKNMSMDEM